MTTQPTEAAFARWVSYVFDHPVSNPEWYFSRQTDKYQQIVSHSQKRIAYLIKLFENPVPYLGNYSDAQINQGLWYLASNACSKYMFAITDQEVDIEHRIQLLNSFYTLNEQLFAPRCSDHLGYLMRTHEDAARANPLNMICYMWWDIVPFYGRPRNQANAGRPFEKRLDEAALEVMARTLTLDSRPCREGALHGLSHWYHAYPIQIQRIINQFLDDNPDLDEELFNYAPGMLQYHPEA